MRSFASVLIAATLAETTSAQRRFVTALLLMALLLGCATIRTHREFEQPLGSPLVASVGSTIFRLNKLGDLPNAFGGRDIWGGKVDRGFAEIKLVSIEDTTLVLDVIDVSHQSVETVMDRYKPFQTGALVRVDVQQSINIGSNQPRPIRLRLDTTKQQELVISGVRVRFLEIQPYSVSYSLEDLQAR